MIIYEYDFACVCLCIYLNDYLWLCMPMYGFVSLYIFCIPLYGPEWLCVIMYDYAYMHLIHSFYSVWIYSILVCSFWLCLTLCLTHTCMHKFCACSSVNLKRCYSKLQIKSYDIFPGVSNIYAPTIQPLINF